MKEWLRAAALLPVVIGVDLVTIILGWLIVWGVRSCWPLGVSRLCFAGIDNAENHDDIQT
jgi:hypothetical protein